ncbi:hypothetical protein TNIN_193441 [Trichonephila inaurata madagascariensis]|uniref:Uncharacterized protein n=1 Tax=Trichonephila inaurata madagascariensis TaxID=2747483 RepID=A0A8X7CFR5_9ARAC|nr:hypothetical protein TNIN_193441 [Trichonephila inaurata madagascariensis]
MVRVGVGDCAHGFGVIVHCFALVCNASMSATIIDMTESHCLKLDGACLTEEPDASEDGEKIASKKEC